MADWYSMPLLATLWIMLANNIRRLCVWFLSLVLAVGLVAHSAQASDIGRKSDDMTAMSGATAKSNMPMSKDCDGCAGDEHAVPAACTACCTGIVVLPATFDSVRVTANSAPLFVFPDRALIGYSGAPDPHPPRPTVLG
jgi:hypothetical protein